MTSSRSGTARRRAPPWSERYPRLTGLLDDNPMAPVGDAVERNILVSSAWGNIHKNALPYLVIKDNLPDASREILTGEPGEIPHVNGEAETVRAMKFEPIPWREIGLYADPGRASRTSGR